MQADWLDPTTGQYCAESGKCMGSDLGGYSCDECLLDPFVAITCGAAMISPVDIAAMIGASQPTQPRADTAVRPTHGAARDEA